MKIMFVQNLKLFLVLCGFIALSSCKKYDTPLPVDKPNDIDTIAANYYEQYLKLYPLEATAQGDNRYNDQLPVNISEEFISGETAFYRSVLDQMKLIKYDELADDKKVVYDVLDYTLRDKIEKYNYHPEYIPFTQFSGLPLEFPLLGSGSGSQPFKTAKDYDDWLGRMKKFPVWMEVATQNFRNGMENNMVLPQALVLKMIPQMNNPEIVSEDMETNIFFGPVKKFPKSFSQEQMNHYKGQFSRTIAADIIPAYKKMADFLQNEYLPKSRPTFGINSLPSGKKMYSYYAKSWTTTDLSPEEILQTGEQEVAMLRSEMEKVKNQVGFRGSLEEFLTHIKTDSEAMPYTTAKEVMNAFNAIQKKIQPKLKNMFSVTPNTPFEIRQTEKFRELTASAEYVQGSADGRRPGIFYIPLPEPEKFNVASGMESLFLHEAIPGHHYQISLQQENQDIPRFMRFGWLGAYGEGWAHYCETLGPELGLYTDPYQKMGYLSDQMLRAVRLVIDTGIHNGTMSREEAIKYFLSNVAYDEASAVAEVERYMAMPGQALSYKVGALKIRELRDKYSKLLGNKFKLQSFHDEVLNQGCLPISVLERKMEVWAKNAR